MGQTHQNAPGSRSGFAGLVDMASNVDAVLHWAEARLPPPPKAQTSAEPSFAHALQLREKKARSLRWLQPGIYAVCYLAAAGWIVYTRPAGDHRTQPQVSSSAPPQVGMPPPQHYEITPADAAAMRADGDVEGAIEQAPPPDTGRLLSFAELHWCLAQKERLTAAGSVPRNDGRWQVSRFNVLVDDYNARCSDYRYQRPAMDRVERIIQAQKPYLDKQGVDLLYGKR